MIYLWAGKNQESSLVWACSNLGGGCPEEPQFGLAGAEGPRHRQAEPSALAATSGDLTLTLLRLSCPACMCAAETGRQGGIVQ